MSPGPYTQGELVVGAGGSGLRQPVAAVGSTSHIVVGGSQGGRGRRRGLLFRGAWLQAQLGMVAPGLEGVQWGQAPGQMQVQGSKGTGNQGSNQSF